MSSTVDADIMYTSACCAAMSIAASEAPARKKRGPWGWTLFVLVWTLAVFGTTLKAVGGVGYPRLSTALYIAMGWLALIAIRPLWARIPVSGWLWLIAGGLAYTAGIAFYACDRRVRYGHFVWHLFVLLGTTCHVFAVLWYAV